MRSPEQKLIVSFHDLHPGSWDCCRSFMERCGSYGVDTMSLLLIPQYHGQPPFTENRAFVRWLKEVSDTGYEICLHGYYHKAENVTGGYKERLVGNYYTTGEGEFYQISVEQARKKLSDGLHLLKQCELPVYGFTAPAWLISDAARQALIESGFRYHSLWSRVELLPSGKSIAAPTLVYGSRSASYRMLSRAWIPFYHQWKGKAPILRLAVHPIDFRYPAVERHLYALLQKALETRTASTYRDLIPEASRHPVGSAPPRARRDKSYRFAQRVTFSDLSQEYLERRVLEARLEDLAGIGLGVPPSDPGDVTSKLLPPGLEGEAALVAREPLIACGIPLIPIILKAYHDGLSFQPEVADGAWVESGQRLAKVAGPAAEMLMAERVLLNFLQFLSGVATLTQSYVDALGPSTTRILDTRKTVPGYRMLQKYAVACGGGWNHRLGLFDRVMLKDNHLVANAASWGEALTELVGNARRRNPELLIEVEVDHLEQIPAALEAAPDKLMLDNFTTPQLKRAVALVDGRVCTEATGGVTLQNIAELGSIGLDFISTGALVHKAVWKDIGLDWSSAASPEG